MSKKLNPEDYLAIKDIMQEQLDVLEKQQAKAESINKVFKDLGTNLFGASNYQKQIVDDLENAKTIAEQEEVIQRRTVELLTTKKFLSSDIKKQILEQLDKRQLQINLDKQAVKVLERQKELSDELASSVDGFIDGIEGKVKSIPVLGGFLAKTMGLDDLRKEFKENVADTFTEHFQQSMKDGKGLSSSIMAGFKGMRVGVMGFGKSLLSAFAPLAPILITLTAIKAVFDFDKKVTELSRNLGISRDAAKEMSASFDDMVLSSTDLSVTSAGLLEAQQQLSESTGMTAQFSEDMLKTQIKLTKFMGLSGEEAANFQKLSMANEMSARDLQLEIAGTVEQFNKGTGASVNLKDVMKDISGLSQTIKANFEGNVIEMAKATTLARSMGISLQDSANAAEKTLSIESSLRNEMTALMLTGERINNNEIRQAQLAGDTGRVLELQKQQLDDMGDISDKTPMQRKAIADAMGLEVDKLLEMNEQNKLNRKFGADISKATLEQINASTKLTKKEKEKLIAQREQLSMQEKMNGLSEKFNKIFVAVGEAVMSIIDSLAPLEPIFNVLIGIINIAMKIVMAPLKLVASLMGGIGSVISGVGSFFSPVGDVMSPADGKTRVSTKEGGLFELSPNDDVVAAPGAADKMKNGSGGGNGALIAKIDQLIGVNREILQKQYVIEMNGNQVGQEINQSERAIQ